MLSNIEANSATEKKDSFLRSFRWYRSHRLRQKNRGRHKKALAYQKKLMGFYSNYIKQGDLCFDIGANEGNRVEPFIKLGATVVAVEPQQQCVQILQDMFKGNERVIVVPKALDQTVGKKEMYICDASTISSMSDQWISSVKESGRFSGNSWDTQVTVETTTLDALIEEFGTPVFCKIDVEGFEYNVLSGLSRPIKIISFEFIPEFIDSTVKCIMHLSQIGPTEFNYSKGESMLFQLPAWLDANDMIRHVESLPKDSNLFGDIYARSTS
jgi:FkbM family methyltransferase